jgi:lysophospholipase L1-like esterase
MAVGVTVGVAVLAGPLAALAVAAIAFQIIVLTRPWARRRPTRTLDPRVHAMALRPALRSVGSAARVALRVVPAAVGLMVVLVALDWGVGTLWEAASGPDGAVTAVDLANEDLPPPEDDRVHTEAMAGSPWASRYFAELEHVPFTYVPFIGPREAPVHGRYINSADGIRLSYEPPGADDQDALTVWFFGGSTLWGEGQRDLHTIPSEVARLAEDDGLTLRVVNFGIRGYTAFQELLVFEQELARGGPPDLAVFYHGANELGTQVEAPENLSRQPTIFQLEITEEAIARSPALPQVHDPGEPSVARDYGDTSVINRLWRRADALLGVQPAAADEPFYVPSPRELQLAIDNAEAIYRRTLPLIEHVAREHDVPPVIFWQPGSPTGDNAGYDELGRRVGHLGIDISEALDDAPAPIYIDGLHTNELGAQISARAIWDHLAPMVEGMDRG